jgi:hypothetical protein
MTLKIAMNKTKRMHILDSKDNLLCPLQLPGPRDFLDAFDMQ